MDDQGASIAQDRRNQLYREMLSLVERLALNWDSDLRRFCSSEELADIITKSRQLYK